MKTLSTHQIFLLHEQLCAEAGGSQGLRDDGLLQSALSAVLRRKWYPSDWPGSGMAQERGIPAPRRPDRYTRMPVSATPLKDGTVISNADMART